MVAVLVTFLIKLIFLGLGSEHPFVLLPAAVVIAAWYGGLGPGIVATALCAVASLYFFLPPAGTGAEPADLVGVGGLLAEGALVVLLTVGLRSALIRAEAAKEASAAAHRETVFALAVRDEMLSLWTQQLRGPMADLESQAREALADLEREAYAGAAEPKLRKLVEEAALVGRATAGWDAEAQRRATSEPGRS